MLIIRRSNCINAASGTIRLVSDHPLHRLFVVLSDWCGESVAYGKKKQSVSRSFIKNIIYFERVRYYYCTSSPINLTQIVHTHYINNPVISQNLSLNFMW